MNAKGDAITGILLAFVGIAILIAWRTGTLKRVLGLSTPASAGSAPSITQLITRIGASDPATSLPTASLVPLTISPQGPGSAVATAGTVDNGYSSTVYPAPHPYSDAGNYVSFQTVRDESYRADRMMSIITGIREASPASSGGGGGSAMLAV